MTEDLENLPTSAKIVLPKRKKIRFDLPVFKDFAHLRDGERGRQSFVGRRHAKKARKK